MEVWTKWPWCYIKGTDCSVVVSSPQCKQTHSTRLLPNTPVTPLNGREAGRRRRQRKRKSEALSVDTDSAVHFYQGDNFAALASIFSLQQSETGPRLLKSKCEWKHKSWGEWVTRVLKCRDILKRRALFWYSRRSITQEWNFYLNTWLSNSNSSNIQNQSRLPFTNFVLYSLVRT